MKFVKSLLLAVFAWTILFIPAQAAAETTTVILVRHGQTDYNVKNIYQGFLDIPLNKTGLNQAKLLAESLKDYPIDVFISSPLKRAYVTAETVAKLHGKTIAYTDDRFKELNYGDFEGKTQAEWKARLPEMYKTWREKPWLITFPNGENIRDLQYRGRNALEDAVAKYPGKTILIGAHSHVNMAIICSVLGLDPQHFRQIKQDNTCVNVLRCKDGFWEVVTINSVAHLGKLTM